MQNTVLKKPGAFEEKAPFSSVHQRKKWWLSVISQLDYALQPIVNIHTGECYGYEALLRNYQAAGFAGISELFDLAHQDKMLSVVDPRLLNKALRKFVQLPHHHAVKLFFNLDNRVFHSPGYELHQIEHLLERYGLSADSLCFEISERHELRFSQEICQALAFSRAIGSKIAMDDFGTGFSGLQLFYRAEPDFIKIDRFFIQNISNDAKKKQFVSAIINLAHLLGTFVIAEGVETELEYSLCKEIGCDLIQGYFVQRAQQDHRELKARYEHIARLHRHDRRKQESDKDLISTNLEYLPPIYYSESLVDIFDIFRKHEENTFFPVLNSHDEPLGVIRESHIKKYTYSLYGKDLLRNPSAHKELKNFLSPIPIADIHTPAEDILEIFSSNEQVEGIVLVDNMRYAGFLSAPSLLKVLNKKHIAAARDQNPLSKLPGNNAIYEYVSTALTDRTASYAFIYFDFDHFKPFNDTYGFRQGDRLILLFSELLKRQNRGSCRFIGHIGGDDFFMGCRNTPLSSTKADVADVIRSFRHKAESFYQASDIQRGCIQAKDRDGMLKTFPLLTVSAVIFDIPASRDGLSLETIGSILAHAKKQAKCAPDNIHIISSDDLGAALPDSTSHSAESQ